GRSNCLTRQGAWDLLLRMINLGIATPEFRTLFQEARWSNPPTEAIRPRWVSSVEKRGVSTLVLIDPAQQVTDNRPARLASGGLLPQNPVSVERVDGAVSPFQLDPGIDEFHPLLIASGHGIGQRYLDDLRFRHDNRVFRVKQSQHRTALGGEDYGVERSLFQSVLDLLDRFHSLELHSRRARFYSINVIWRVWNRDGKRAELPDGRPAGKLLAQLIL